MSYLVLARKARPQSFEEIVGQRTVVKTLKNSLRKKRVAHAILFSGVRGVGKTTLARIMAKALNCHNDSPPCNTCTSCKEITEGSALDLYEIDGASNRGIQEIRELKEKLRFLPTSSQFKIIIIDEVHMLTTEAFNALLKTLEEPPKHVYFLFATTEVHKIPITILSRCQRYELQRVSSDDLTKHFFQLARNEGVDITASAMALIVREAEGSVRDGLSLLDQMFSFGENKVTKEDVVEVLGLIDRDILHRITNALLERNKSEAMLALDGAFSYGIDVKRFTIDLLDCFRTLLLCKINNCQLLLDMPEEEIDVFNNIASKYSAETLHRKLHLLMKMAEDIRFSPQSRLSLEISFIKIIEAENVTPIAELLGQLDTAIHTLSESQLPLDSKEETSTAPVDKIAPSSSPKIVTQEKVVLSKTQDVEEPTPIIDTAPKEPQPQEESVDENIEVVKVNKEEETKIEIKPRERDIRKYWLEFTEYVKDRKMWMSKDLLRADSAKQVDDELHINYTDPANCALIRTKENHKLLTEFALDFFQKELKIRFVLPEVKDTDDANDVNSPQQQRQKLVNDPLVQMTVEIFGGQVGDIRVGPRSR